MPKLKPGELTLEQKSKKINEFFDIEEITKEQAEAIGRLFLASVNLTVDIDLRYEQFDMELGIKVPTFSAYEIIFGGANANN